MGEPGGLLGEVCGQSDVGGERGLEVGVGGGQGRVDSVGGVGEGLEERGGGEDGCNVLFPRVKRKLAKMLSCE